MFILCRVPYYIDIYLKFPLKLLHSANRNYVLFILFLSGIIPPRVGQHKEKMPKLLHLLQTMRSWRIDTPEEMPSTLSPSTPIITILPSVEEPEKQKHEKKEEIAGKSQAKEEEAENGPLVSDCMSTITKGFCAEEELFH